MSSLMKIKPVLGRIYARSKLEVKALWYKGTRRTCCFCNRQASTFLPAGFDVEVLRKYHVVGGGFRDEAKCPYCFSLDRVRLLDLFLEHCTNVSSEAVSVLHIAPEYHVVPRLKSVLKDRYITGDLAAGAADSVVDVTAIPFPDASFDAVICNHVLEHVPDDGLAMRELFRVLKSGGWAVLQVPSSNELPATLEDPTLEDEEERLKKFGQRDHIRLYGRDYLDRLKTAGFQATLFDWKTDPRFGGSENQFGLCENELVHYCTKP